MNNILFLLVKKNSSFKYYPSYLKNFLIRREVYKHFRKTVKNVFGLSFEGISNMLKENQALIAGGSITHSIIPFEEKYSGDLDIWIYFPIENEQKQWKRQYEELENLVLPLLIYFIEKEVGWKREFFNHEIVEKHESIGYLCNVGYKILRMIKLTKRIKNEDKRIQILVVDKPCEEVVSHFDLSCCSLWYNGIEFGYSNSNYFYDLMYKKTFHLNNKEQKKLYINYNLHFYIGKTEKELRDICYMMLDKIYHNNITYDENQKKKNEISTAFILLDRINKYKARNFTFSLI